MYALCVGLSVKTTIIATINQILTFNISGKNYCN